MARLNQAERDSLRRFAAQPPLPHPPPLRLPFPDYLRAISQLPPSPAPPKPATFPGSHWRI
jgi:hypothetical protein